MRQFWPKESRILRSRDFRKIQRNGRKWKSRDLLFLYLPNKLDRLRIGLVVSKKVGNAVVRNKSKRWLREIFRKQISDSFLKGGDIVVIVFSSFIQQEFLSIESQCIKALKSIHQKL